MGVPHALPFLSYGGVSPSAYAQKCSLLAYVLSLKWQEMQSPVHSSQQNFPENHTFPAKTVFYKHSFLYSKFIALLCCCPDRNYAQTYQYSCNSFLAWKSINKSCQINKTAYSRKSVPTLKIRCNCTNGEAIYFKIDFPLYFQV